MSTVLFFALACAPIPTADTTDSGALETDEVDTADSGALDTDEIDTADSACDPTVRSIDVPDLVAARSYTQLTVVPSALDPETDNYPQSEHKVLVADDPEIPMREELLVILPGTANTPDGFDELAEIAARSGYPVIVLAWDSEVNQATLCATATTPEEADTCRTAVIDAKAYGSSDTTYVDIGEPDSIVGRLDRLLRHLEAEYPGAGVDRWVDTSGPTFENIALVGFSQGAVLAGYLSMDHAFARTVLLAGGCDAATDDSGVVLGSWCTAPRATPPERTWALSHLRDEPLEDAAIHEAYGLPALGDYVAAEDNAPAYCTGTHLLTTDLTPGGTDTNDFHLSVAHDSALPLDADGVPLLGEDYVYLFTAE